MKHYPLGEKIQIKVNVNGNLVEADVEPRKLLSDFIREDCGLTGTHVGCEQGICGACTVLLNGVTVRSCLIFAVQVDNQNIQTVEGISNEKLGQILNEEFTEHHALQCGFCTPGILASAYNLLQEKEKVTREDVSEMLSGHICRCTGYLPIIDAVKYAAERKNNRGDI